MRSFFFPDKSFQRGKSRNGQLGARQDHRGERRLSQMRKRNIVEILSYSIVGLLELGLFVFTLLLRLGILTHIPFHLPRGLPFNRAEIGAAISIGIGLFPAAYWHRTSISQVRERMAKDAQVLKERDGGVHVRSNVPGEWMN